MKLLLVSLCLVFAAVECGHTFAGTSVLRPLIHHEDLKYSANFFTKRLETFKYSMPKKEKNYGWKIQGILAYDLTGTGASINITQGGVGHDYVEMRLKSDRADKLHYDLFIYA